MKNVDLAALAGAPIRMIFQRLRRWRSAATPESWHCASGSPELAMGAWLHRLDGSLQKDFKRPSAKAFQRPPKSLKLLAPEGNDKQDDPAGRPRGKPAGGSSRRFQGKARGMARRPKVLE